MRRIMNSINRVEKGSQLPLAARLMGLLELTKLELTGLSVLTALCAFYVAAESIDAVKILWVGAGTWLVGASAGVFNQFRERTYDGMMRRTERRPLPAGRISPVAALSFGIGLTVSGAIVLLAAVNVLAMALALATVGFYILVYTPLKRKTPLATGVGAIPGAMPPLIGWAAARGDLEIGAYLFFGLVYLWQLPHFLSIAWMYQRDYVRAGFRVLSVSDTRGTQTGVIVLISTVLLIPESFFLFTVGEADVFYLVGASVAGALFAAEAWRFYTAVARSGASWAGNANSVSRRLFFASLVYLPVVMVLLCLDKL
jgi:protoheme IX farnesyltransferase